jgi:hypothetical protein
MSNSLTTTHTTGARAAAKADREREAARAKQEYAARRVHEVAKMARLRALRLAKEDETAREKAAKKVRERLLARRSA